MLRRAISTMALAMGFAAFSRRRGASRTLLEEALHGWIHSPLRSLTWRRAGAAPADASYYKQLSQQQKNKP